MLRRLLLIGCVVVLGARTLCSVGVARPVDPPSPPESIKDDPANNISSQKNKIKSWVSRNGDNASVLTVKGDGTGTLALYRFSPGVTQTYKVFESSFKSQVASMADIKSEFHKVKFTRVSADNSPILQFAIFLESDMKSSKGDYANAVGWFTFISSNGRERKLSRILVRLNPDRKVTSTIEKQKTPSDEKGADYIVADPCKGPPTDDVGEEELLAATTTAGLPDREFPKTPTSIGPDN